MSNPDAAVRPPITFERLLHHVVGPRGYPEVSIEVPPETPATGEDIAIAERLIRAWDGAIAAEPGNQRATGDVWEMVGYEFHREFVAAMQSRDPSTVASILVRFFRHSISYGMGGGPTVIGAVSDPNGNRQVATMAVDRIAAVAVALGVLPCENPEQGRYGENLYMDPVEIESRIEAKIGIRFCPPAIGGYLGLRLRGGLFFPTAGNQLYAAWRLAELTAEAPVRRLCEIGGGYGGCAYYAHLLGLHDYRLFDLPVVNVLQGYYLIKALPAAKVVLFGEEEFEDALCVYPYWLLRKQPDRSFGAVLNQDSLPEIAAPVAQQYLREIGRAAYYFLSINQESQGPSGPPGVHQNSVPEMADALKVLQRVARYPFWLRPGYVEEVYRCAPQSEGLTHRIVRFFRC